MRYAIFLVKPDGAELVSAAESWTSPEAVGKALGMNPLQFVQAASPDGVGYEIPHGDFAGSRAFIRAWVSPALIVAPKPGSCAPDNWHDAIPDDRWTGADREAEPCPAGFVDTDH